MACYRKDLNDQLTAVSGIILYKGATPEETMDPCPQEFLKGG